MQSILHPHSPIRDINLNYTADFLLVRNPVNCMWWMGVMHVWLLPVPTTVAAVAPATELWQLLVCCRYSPDLQLRTLYTRHPSCCCLPESTCGNAKCCGEYNSITFAVHSTPLVLQLLSNIILYLQMLTDGTRQPSRNSAAAANAIPRPAMPALIRLCRYQSKRNNGTQAAPMGAQIQAIHTP